MTRDLRFEEVYPYPPDVVWRAITSREALAEWLAPNDFEPALGRPFEFRSDPKPGWDGIIRCQVLEVDPPRTLRYSWVSANGAVDTLVRFTLEPVPEGTRLLLEHTGFRGAKSLMISFLIGAGWRRILRHRVRATVERLAARP